MLRARVLGDLTIELDESELEPPASKRARALLGFLALDRRMHARSSVAPRFWPDVLDESARTSLRSALSALRRALGPDADRYLIATREEVGLAGDSLVWTDIAEFDRCVSEGRLEDALELCRGELLAGLDEDWVYERRDEHRERVASVLARLAADEERAGDLERAIAHTRREVTLDPLAEEPQRNLMRRLAAAGDRAGALRAYEQLGQRLRDELRIAPSPATRELAEALRRGGDNASSQVPSTRAEPAGGVVTLLFTDLVGSTELLSELGDDEAERFRRVHFGLLRDVAAGHSGQEVKNLGDGLMVAFTSAVGAVSCAIGIQQAVHRHNTRERDDRLRVRVGLNVGEPIRDEGDYFGTPVVVAKRLCDKAEGGQILASELLRGLVGTRGAFAFRSLGPVALKGLADPLPAVEIGWEPAVERRVALPGPFGVPEYAPLVGRDADLAALRRSWQAASGGDRRVVVLVGEPGIGKTRLAAEFCRAAYEQGAMVLLGRCYEESLAPYQAFVEALRHYVSETPVDELRLALGSHRPTLARLLPELAEASSPASRSTVQAGEREQFLLFEAVAALVRAVADGRPLVLVLDDLHWADAPTLMLLRHVSRATEGAPLLILGTYRETEIDERHPLEQALAELRRARWLDRVDLRGLSEEAVAALIASQADNPRGAAFARSIADRTQGNPFFVEELLRAVGVEHDALTRIPDSVKDLLERRLLRLDDECRRLLTIAAVSGHEFALEVLERVSGLAADRVAETLEQAIAAHIVEESTSSIGRYSFAHALIRETIYNQISLTRRAQLHRRTGEALEGLLDEQADLQAAALAYHFSAAGVLAKAYDYHSRAAAAAERVYAIEPALTHYTAALEAAAELGLQADREPAVRALLLQRGRTRFRTADEHGATVDVEAALDAARRSGDRAIEMETLNELGFLALRSDLSGAVGAHEAALEIARELGDTTAQTNALDRLAVIASHRLEFDRALELGERALELARGTGDEEVVGRAMDSIKLAVWQLGDLARLEELTAGLETLWRRRGDLWYLQFTLLESAFAPLGAGSWEAAERRLGDALAINRRTRDPATEALMRDALCWLHRGRGAYPQALSAGKSAVERAAEVGFWHGWTAATLGGVLLDLGAPALAAEALELGLAASERAGRPSEIVRCAGQLAWARLLLGAEDEATQLAGRAHDLLGRVTGGVFLFGTHAYTGVARVLLATGAPERGVQLVRPVLEAAERSGWRELVAMTELVLGLCHEAGNEPEQARVMLARAASSGISAPALEAHLGLARLADEPGEHVAAAETIIERIAADLTDDALRASLRARAPQ